MSALPVKSLPHTLQCRHTCPRVDKQGENTEMYIILQSNSDPVSMGKYGYERLS